MFRCVVKYALFYVSGVLTSKKKEWTKHDMRKVVFEIRVAHSVSSALCCMLIL